jgi:hypothetical protein
MLSKETFEINSTEHRKAQRISKIRNLAKGNKNPAEKAAAEKKAGGPKLVGETKEIKEIAFLAAAGKVALAAGKGAVKQKAKQVIKQKAVNVAKGAIPQPNRDQQNEGVGRAAIGAVLGSPLGPLGSAAGAAIGASMGKKKVTSGGKKVKKKATNFFKAEPKVTSSEGVVAFVKKGLDRDKKAKKEKDIKNRKAVPYAALAAEHQPEGEEVVNELTNTTLLGYTQKATNQLAFKGDGSKKAQKRATGVKKATARLAIRASDPDGSMGYNKNPKNEDWQPEITHSKMGDATKKAAEKKKKEAQKGLPPHLQGDWLGKARKAFKENYRVLARDKGDKGRPAQFSYKDEKDANKFADSIKSKGGKATVAKEDYYAGTGEKVAARTKKYMDKKGQKGAPGLDAMKARTAEHKAKRGVKEEVVDEGIGRAIKKGVKIAKRVAKDATSPYDPGSSSIGSLGNPHLGNEEKRAKERAAKRGVKEDKAFDFVVAKLKKQHGDGVLTKGDKMPQPSAAQKKKNAEIRAKRAKEDHRDPTEKASDGRYSDRYSNRGSD